MYRSLHPWLQKSETEVKHPEQAGGGVQAAAQSSITVGDMNLPTCSEL